MGRKKLTKKLPEVKSIIKRNKLKIKQLSKSTTSKTYDIPHWSRFKADNPPPQDIITKLEPIWKIINENQDKVSKYREKQKELESYEILCTIKDKERFCPLFKQKEQEIIPVLNQIEQDILQTNTKIHQMKKHLPKFINYTYDV